MTISTPVERQRRLARRALFRPLTWLDCKAAKRTILSLLAASVALGATAAQADLIEAVPNTWRLQDYGPSGLNLYYTGSSCPSGQLVMPSGTGYSPDRFWATVMTAKVTGRMVGIYYHVTNGSCVIDSFYLRETS